MTTTTPFFFNQCLDKGRLKRMILWSLAFQGEYKTIQIIENLKTLGFQYATYAGVSLGIDDLSVPPKKRDEVIDAETFVTRSTHGGYRGNRTAVEELQSVIDTWHRTSENVKQHVIDYFEATNILNPVYMMAFSGARGNVSQVRQLVGMRGLMADPKGDIIGFPIRSNFREGLTVTEYMISCYGARKGVVDTALRTADAGYLTRRLVDVSQHMVVKQGSCGTRRGITISELQSYGKTVLKLPDRLVGRVLAADFVHEGQVVARRNEPISEVLADQLAALRKASKGQSKSPLLVRSPLTCELRSGVCQLCYGWSLAQNAMVTIGEAVGIIAGQSIGEPGTQLTMRTFHTGGVFTGDVDEEFRTPHGGRVTFPTPFPGRLVRTAYGQIAFLVKTSGHMLITDEQRNIQTKLTVPTQTALFVREGQYVRPNELVGLFDGVGARLNERIRTNKIVFSELSGQVICEDISRNSLWLRKKYRTLRRPKYSTTARLGTVWILAGDRLDSTGNLLPMYQSSGHLLGPQSTLTRPAVRGQQDGFVCLRSEMGTTMPPTVQLLPPGATYRMIRSRRVQLPAPVSDYKALYTPLVTGYYRLVRSGVDVNYTRIITSTGDCVDFSRKLFETTIWAHETTLKSKRSSAVMSASRSRVPLAFTYLPAIFKTTVAGAFWCIESFMEPSRRHGILPYTARFLIGARTATRWSRRRLSWQTARRSLKVSSTGRKSRTAHFAHWLIAGHALDYSITLQAQPKSTVSPIYGLIQSARPLQILPPLTLESSQVRRNPYLVQNQLRADVASYDLSAAVAAFKPLASLYQFPFSVVPHSSPRACAKQVYPSWLYFPKPSIFNPTTDSTQVEFDLATPLQTFIPALFNVQADLTHIPLRHRTHRLMARVASSDVLRTAIVTCPDPVPQLGAIRQVFLLRHPELLQFMSTTPMRACVSQAYRAAQQMYVFTHVISPWVSCVQPSAYTLTADTTLHFTERFMGWLYKSKRIASAFVPVAYYQSRDLHQVHFSKILTETFVIAHAPIAAFSVDHIQTVQRRLALAQSLEGAQMQDQSWVSRPAIWVKQEVTARESVITPPPSTQNILCFPPLRRWLRGTTYALRVKSQTKLSDGFTSLELTLTNPVKQNSLQDCAWSVGVFSHPSKFDSLLGVPNTLHLADEPLFVRPRHLKDAGETFVTDEHVTDVPPQSNVLSDVYTEPDTRHVIMLRARHLIAFSIENVSETPCVRAVGEVLRYGDEILPGLALPVSGQILSITPSQIVIRRGQPVLYYKAAELHVQNHQWIPNGSPVVTLAYQRLITGDIVQGIPKVEQVFEASRRRDATFNAHRFVSRSFRMLKAQYPITVATRQTIARVQRQIIDRIQQIYLSQGVSISDKHFEVVVRQMTSHVRILDPGKSGLFRNEVVSLRRVERINLGMLGMQKHWMAVNERKLSTPELLKARYVPVVLGISAAALNSDSFLSSASFQETTRVLSRDALLTRTDFLGGLKERVILGDLIPAGTGLFETIRYRKTATSARVT